MSAAAWGGRYSDWVIIIYYLDYLDLDLDWIWIIIWIWIGLGYTIWKPEGGFYLGGFVIGGGLLFGGGFKSTSRLLGGGIQLFLLLKLSD